MGAGVLKGLEMEYAYKSNRPSQLLNTLFMSTVNVASRTLVNVAANVQPEHSERWKPGDHLRFMVMLMTWLTVWVMRVLMDFFPVPMTWSPHHLLSAAFSPLKLALPAPSGFSSSSKTTSFNPPSTHVSFPYSSAKSEAGALVPAAAASSSPMDLVLQQDDYEDDVGSLHALGRSLTHILALLNEIPASSGKYQFAMAMADRIMDGNFKDGHPELQEINRFALSSAYARTLALLYRSLQRRSSSSPSHPDSTASWTTRAIRSLPFGSYALSYVRGLNYCLTTVLQIASSGVWRGGNNKNQLLLQGGDAGDDVVSEKLAEELVWLTNKLRNYGLVEEAVVQWSHASGLASMALAIDARVQGLIVKTTAILIGEMGGDRGEKVQVPGQVKSRLLVVWLPVLCHANNGLTYPVLTSIEKVGVERAIDDVMATLPGMDQEVILTNWIHDYTVTASDWPNLQVSYDRWCQSTRELAA
ncbi:unnamed protein product [Linum tenue]|uniref:At3g05675-like ankyrin-like domain-containing protein n=1 Tax=Linum tenue TaxID=586396 RepID=A0AAV0K2Z3_9ROSI|nr:unnamed protein product [Linum tenue]